MSVEKMPWFQFFVADYLLSERVQDLEPLAELAYFRCLIHQWWSDNGKLSSETRMQKVSKLTPEEWEKHRDAVMDFFESDDEGIYEENQYLQWCEKKALREKNQASGRKGGQASAKRVLKHSLKRVSKQTEAETETETEPQNPKPDLRDPLENFVLLSANWSRLTDSLVKVHPRVSIPNPLTEDWKKWRTTLKQLVTIGKKPYSEQEVVDTLDWVLTQESQNGKFTWRAQCKSFGPLRVKMKNDVPKFDGMFDAWKKSISTQKPGLLPMPGPERKWHD